MEKELFGYIVNSDGYVWNKKHTGHLVGKTDKDGYTSLTLSIDGKVKYMRLHRLVAMAFVENKEPDNYNVVNHLDGNKQNNNYTNLEWTNVSGNTKHAIMTGLYTPPNTSKKTVILNTITNEVMEFNSRKECEEYYGKEYRSIVGSRQTKNFSHLREVV